MPMSPRERMMEVLAGRRPDALPLLADLSYWYSAHFDTLEERYKGADGYIRLHEDLGCVYYYDYTDFSSDGYGVLAASLDSGVEVSSKPEGPDTVLTVRTPGGELTARARYMPESCSSAHIEHWVKKAEDLKIVREYFEALRYAADYEAFLSKDRHIGARGMYMVCAPQSPLSVLMVRFAGVETTSYLSVDAPEEFAKTLDCIDEALDPAFELMCKSPAYLFHFADNLSAENVGGFFERYLAPYYRKRAAQLHSAGKICVTHLDGTIRGLLGPVAACGMDGVEALTPEPVGDVALEELRSEAGRPDVVLWGGIPGALFSRPYGADDILRQVDSIRRLCQTDALFLPGTADQVPPDADINLVRLASDALAAR